MLTGRMPSAHGVHDWLIGGRHPDAYSDRYLEGQPTTPEVPERAGYQCAMSGKWHVGDSRWPAPVSAFWYANRYGGGPHYGAQIWLDGEPAEESRYFTDAVSDNAVEFLATQDAERPFYLQVNFTAPHDPWIDSHSQELVQLYDATDFPSIPREPPHPWVERRRADFAAAFVDPRSHLAGYCAALTAVDNGVAASVLRSRTGGWLTTRWSCTCLTMDSVAAIMGSGGRATVRGRSTSGTTRYASLVWSTCREGRAG